MSRGFVYILTNPSMPGLVKIGRTTRDVEQRIKELSAATGVPTPFELVEAIQTPDCEYLESLMHLSLEGLRVNEGREFFRVDTKRAVDVLSDTHMSIVREFVEEFAPGFIVSYEPVTVSDSDVMLVAQRVGADIYDVASALSYVEGDELTPALNRWNLIRDKRRANADTLKVVGEE